MENKKKLPIGIEFFRDIRTEGYYYVDKTGLIRELLDGRGSVNLITRPRRFGKSLNLDMLRSFFEIGTDPSLFAGLEIAEERELCEQHMGKYPVLSVSLKDVAGEDYETARDSLGILVSELAERSAFLMDSEVLLQTEKAKLARMMEGDFEKTAYLHNGLRLLTRLLCKHYGTKVIVLIDEYDVPLDKAFQNGYYPQMVDLIRSLFGPVLKTNENLYFAVITGCLRIARESIFTGLNNFKVRTLSDVDYAEYFGFTDGEVRAMLQYYGIPEAFGKMKEWYDGYHIGSVDIYCPWDVLNQCDRLRLSKDAPMEAHWENSSSNAIVRDILEHATATTKDQIEALISGEYVEKRLMPELTYTDLDSGDEETRQTYLWSVLFSTGYLTDAGLSGEGLSRLRIPNREVRGIYEKRIRSWFREKVTMHSEQWLAFCNAVKSGRDSEVQELYNEFLSNSVSIRDTCVRNDMKENYYHGMLLGLLQAKGNWVVKSNAESGAGYADIQIEIPAEKTGCVIEVKYAQSGRLDAACKEALEQIEKKGYAKSMRRDGMETIHKYGIACYKKSCQVVCRSD